MTSASDNSGTASRIARSKRSSSLMHPLHKFFECHALLANPVKLATAGQ
jgi:hypothetical protein